MKILINKKIECEWEGKTSVCKCGQQIGWAKTAAGKWMPFDDLPDYPAHWSTCKNAKDFKKKKL